MLLSKYKKKSYSLFNRNKKNAGRNNTGRITVAHQGGGHKQLYRKISFLENFEKGTVVNIEYDPNRSAHIAKICTKTQNNQNKYYYILSPKNLKILDNISPTNNNNSNENNQKQVGNFYYLHEFNVGDFIYNIELLPNKGGQIVRAAGTFAQVLQKTEEYTTISLPSGEHRLVSSNCKACFGNVSNENHWNVVIKKAGRSRWLNRKPTVRGVAMNPIDHPHGGNTSGGKHHKTPWSRLTKGRPTRSAKKNNKMIVKSYKTRNTI
jgi:large subunit ribosomal protein L2